MNTRWQRVAVPLVACVVVSACSSSGSGAHGATSTGAGTTTSADGSVQAYLDSVNALCTALLPKVIAVTHGGSLDFPVADYLAQQPAHAKLLADFDASLAKVPVPAAAKAKAATLAAYIRFANQLDAKRLAAARVGEAAYAAEIASESGVENDPAVIARNAAGFDPSCDAR